MTELDEIYAAIAEMRAMRDEIARLNAEARALIYRMRALSGEPPLPAPIPEPASAARH
jgi:hypothetical protein